MTNVTKYSLEKNNSVNAVTTRIPPRGINQLNS